MRLTRTALLFIVLIILLSIFVANISNMINVNVHSSDILDKNEKNDFVPDRVIIGHKPDHLFWFVQISDIHLSIFHDLERITDLQNFCDKTVAAIKPSVVLATGDLTDAKQQDNIGSQQYDEEWKKYRFILDNCKSLKKTVWLDIRGNHDNFDVPGPHSHRNFYRQYSLKGKESQSYGYIQQSPDGITYGFVGLDACPHQGLRRPFNFIGLLTEDEMLYIKKLPALKANYTIWFGHYPTSCILSQGSKVRKLIGEEDSSLAYLCGHLHTLGGLVPQMYTLQQQGFLELELGDWKDNRLYRVAAIDHGLFSFVDVKHKDWPVILITNPKHALFTAPSKEPIDRMKKSTHIRILVFSIAEILKVDVRIDEGEWVACQHVKGPLYTINWEPIQYEKGIHSIHVMVLDKNGREKTISQPFSLDGSRIGFRVLPRIFLMSNLTIVFQICFGIAMLGTILPLCLIRYLDKQIKCRKVDIPVTKNMFLENWTRRLWIVSNIDSFFYPITLYPIYLLIGPWCIGELIQGYIGILFAWGTFINGSFLPGGLTYAYGFFQLFLFQGPIIMLTGYKLDSRIQVGRMVHQRKVTQVLSEGITRCIFFGVILCQITLAYGFWLSYGLLALTLSPFRIWPLLLSCWTYHHSYIIPESKIRRAASVWLQKEHCDQEGNEDDVS